MKTELFEIVNKNHRQVMIEEYYRQMEDPKAWMYFVGTMIVFVLSMAILYYLNGGAMV